MDNQTAIKKTVGQEQLGYNSNFFKYIFKKTEKIVCAVFYITSNIKDNKVNNEDTIKDLEGSARGLLEVAHMSLSQPLEQADSSIEKLQYALIALESKLRILQASFLLSEDLLNVFVSEIDSVLRTSNNYKKGTENPLFERDSELVRVSRRSQVSATQSSAEPSVLQTESVHQQKLPNRRGRILSVLREKGKASIKDISEVVKDCSEKTIQRELNDMIRDNIISREGERRWSKYSVIQ